MLSDIQKIIHSPAGEMYEGPVSMDLFEMETEDADVKDTFFDGLRMRQLGEQSVWKSPTGKHLTCEKGIVVLYRDKMEES